MTTAFAEIIQKFRDEPLEALSTWQALLYHALNGVIAMFTLQVLLAAGFQIESAFEKIQVYDHFSNWFARGLVDTSQIAFYVGGIAFFLFLTVLSLGSRRWR